MQFVTRMQRFTISRIGMRILILSVVLIVALATLVVWRTAIAPVLTSSEVSAPQIVARYNPYMGEGRVNIVRSTASRPIAHHVEGQGEGWLAYGKQRNATTEPVSTVIGCGQGEGLLNLHIPHDAVCERR
jgi:hypothetical protein